MNGMPTHHFRAKRFCGSLVCVCVTMLLPNFIFMNKIKE